MRHLLWRFCSIVIYLAIPVVKKKIIPLNLYSVVVLYFQVI